MPCCPAKRLWLLGTGTGLAPFLAIIKDPDIYAAYEQVILVHGVRYISELAYSNLIENELPHDEYLGDDVRNKLVYYPTVTREPYRNNGRITELIMAGKLQQVVGLKAFNPAADRFMLCGSPSMLKQTSALLQACGMTETRNGHYGEYVIERAFVE